ncbi:MAG: carbon storage regulator [Alphaproteobacteria bacterium]|nr:carbon storage regulator [Alphaproteobacteria bacterium]
MINIKRKVGQEIVIGADIRVRVLGVSGKTVQVGVATPAGVQVLRAEIYDAVLRANVDSIVEVDDLT